MATACKSINTNITWTIILKLIVFSQIHNIGHNIYLLAPFTVEENNFTSRLDMFCAMKIVSGTCWGSFT